MVPLSVIRWAAQECEWQESGERSVAWMAEGWLYAQRNRNRAVALKDVLALGAIVEPRHNRDGLRRTGVRVGWNMKMHADLVPEALGQLLVSDDLEPTEWFRQYEEIHPFRDGNGRTGNILFNWRSSTLLDPVFPPNLWADSRRDGIHDRRV